MSNNTERRDFWTGTGCYAIAAAGLAALKAWPGTTWIEVATLVAAACGAAWTWWAGLMAIKGRNTKSKEMIRLLDEWLADDSGYDEETWPQLAKRLKKAIKTCPKCDGYPTRIVCGPQGKTHTANCEHCQGTGRVRGTV